MVSNKLENLKKRTQILFKKIQKEEEIDEEICDDYVDDLEELKEDLLNNDQYWVNNLPYINKVGGILRADDEEIEETMDKIERQLDRILTKLGIDSDEDGKKRTSQGINIQVNPSFSQSQSQMQYQSVNIDVLIKEFEEELKKPQPDKSKLRNIIEKILEFGKEYSPRILKLILDYFLI